MQELIYYIIVTAYYTPSSFCMLYGFHNYVPYNEITTRAGTLFFN